ncbi:MAG TPA: hypothetical protein VG325_02865 [Solirubrobacteraceae bacterium]|jgi:hypothetical protein|nr:hypothetical protein [Solirubrobacteraceae bacterium]
MTDRQMRRFLASAAVVAAITASAGVLSASAANPRAPAKDRFTATAAATGGRLGGYRGAATLSLYPRHGAATRRLKITVIGGICRAAKRCLRLSGTLSGTIKEQPAKPDRGQTFVIGAAGTLAPLGRVSGSGGGQGTGFVHAGHESLWLSFAGQGGRVSMTGESGRVPAYTAP